MKIGLQTRVVRSPSPVETTVGSEVVLMVLATGKCYGLGETGSDVWRLLQSPTTPAEAVLKLQQEYDAPAEVLETDVLDLLEELRTEDLIRLCE